MCLVGWLRRVAGGGSGGVKAVSRNTGWRNPVSRKTGIQQAYWAKVKVVAYLLFDTHFDCSVAKEILQLHRNVCFDLAAE